MTSPITKVGRGTWSLQTEAAQRAALARNCMFTLEIGSGPITTDMEARIAAFPARSLESVEPGSRVTALAAVNTVLGGVAVQIVEGTFEDWGFPVLRPLGHQKGYRLGENGHRVLDWIPGTGKSAVATLVRSWDENGALLPPTRKLAVADLAAASVAHPVAVLYTHPGFGSGPVPGCVWLVEGYDAETDIVDGFLWVPSGGDPEPEHGSIYGRQLFGRAAFIETHPARVDPWTLGGTYQEAWMALFPLATVAAA